jgi:hypothetical protein
LDDRRFFLLWCDGGNERDYYVLCKHESPQLLLARSKEEVIEYADRHGLQVSDQPTHIVDFNVLNGVLAGLRPGKPFSENAARELLDIWNTLDDVSHSLNKCIMPVDLFSKEDVDNLYEKIFYGNNLPSVTPEGKKYSPLFDAKERSILRSLLGHAIKEVTGIVERVKATEEAWGCRGSRHSKGGKSR